MNVTYTDNTAVVSSRTGLVIIHSSKITFNKSQRQGLVIAEAELRIP